MSYGGFMIDSVKMQDAVQLFKTCSPLFIALGDEIRQKLLLLLADAGFEGINVQNLASKTHLSRPAVSHHLKVLKDAGIITPVKKGTESFYHLCIGDKLPHFHKLILQIESIISDMNEEEKEIFYNQHPDSM